MEDLKNNKFLLVFILVTIFNIVFFVGGKFLINKVTDQVIQKLQKEYSPSFYGPGFDPDKISPDAFQRKSQNDLRQSEPKGDGNWRRVWEQDRSH